MLSRIKEAARTLRPLHNALHTSCRCLREVQVEGHTINVEEAGTGGEVVLCLPGALGTIESDFGPQLRGLGSSGVRVVVWDPPGYGKSVPPQRNFHLDFLRSDASLAAAMMKTLGYDRYSLVGWSDGGITALVMAAAAPQAVSSLVVVGANAYVGEEDARIYQSIRDVDKWSARMRAPLEATYGAHNFRKLWEDWTDTYLAIYRERDGDLCKADLAGIQCPTLIVHGAKDPVVPIHHPHYLHQHIKGAQLHIMAEGKHNLHLRYPEEFNKLVLDFLKKKY